MDDPLLAACIVLCLIMTVYSQNPIVTITEPKLEDKMNKYVAHAGTMVDFVCVVRNKPVNRKVQWITNRGGQTELVADDVDPMDPRYSLTKPNPISWKLRIKNVQVSMNGPYICQIVLNANSETKDVIYLEVMERPKINNIVTSKDKTKTEGEELDLRCKASGIPSPVVKWTRLGYAGLPGGGEELRDEVLYIKSIRASHRGKYICQAENIAGRDTRTIMITVRFRPIVTPQHKTVYQKEGHGKVLMCDVEAYPQPTESQISWAREMDNKELDDNYVQRISLGANDRLSTRLYIKKVRSADYGKYTCTASNNFGTRRAYIELKESDEALDEPSIGAFTYSSSSMLTSRYISILSVVSFIIVVLVSR